MFQRSLRNTQEEIDDVGKGGLTVLPYEKGTEYICYN